jgi:predicted DnaQ family exonuclease/DinG family helicase
MMKPLLEQSIFADVWVCIDLETTGLSYENDEIIEVGAVKFQGINSVETFQTFVNPKQQLSDFIKSYTGIRQEDVEYAPSFSSVSDELASFIGSSPIVGHNIKFDIGFLERQSLHINNPKCDTWDIAYIMLPGIQSYSLQNLVSYMKLECQRPHRALDDAMATKEVFIELLKKMCELDTHTLVEIDRLSKRSSWSMSYLMNRIISSRIEDERVASTLLSDSNSDVVDTSAGKLTLRLKQAKSLKSNSNVVDLDEEFVASLLAKGGPLHNVLPGFESRPEQVAMTREVARAINNHTSLVAEAGTGVGKSLAYLIPAAIYALKNQKRVVISTNTINLQEQLCKKDVPILVKALNGIDDISAKELRFTQLKGRANYLCLQRWNNFHMNEILSETEAIILAKIRVWLQNTDSGDRSELNLGNAASMWERLSAQGAMKCPGVKGPCFLRAAREKATAAHLIITNHALLLSDLVTGGSILPDHDVLIVDEAHHLEEEATRRLGFELGRYNLDEYLNSFNKDHGFVRETLKSLRGLSSNSSRLKSFQEIVDKMTPLVTEASDQFTSLLAYIMKFINTHLDDAFERNDSFRVTKSIRSQPDWSVLEMEWQKIDIRLVELAKCTDRLQIALEGFENSELLNHEDLMSEVSNVQQIGIELRQRLAEFVTSPDKNGIYWMTWKNRGRDPVMHAAPLHVGEILNRTLFSKKSTVVMTSATLSTNSEFTHFRERIGFTDSQELLLGSPFEFSKCANLLIPEDMPEPRSKSYQLAVDQAIMDAALAVGGHTMALFTSHASLKLTAEAIRGKLKPLGIPVLAQHIDGTPTQLMRRFLNNPKAVLLGTSSFWEGVDIAGEALEVLLLTRLPFNVPSEPVFAARSELYETPFYEYAVPQAILRFRQGFGRLIRSKTDRGVVVVLDRRIISKGYGKLFVGSLPDLPVKTCKLGHIRDEIRDWIGR